MKFKDIDLENDYFGHGFLDENTLIYSYRGYADGSFDIFKFKNNQLNLVKNIHPREIVFSFDDIIDSDNWFVLKEIMKHRGTDLNNIKYEWELWR